MNDSEVVEHQMVEINLNDEEEGDNNRRSDNLAHYRRWSDTFIRIYSLSD